jgi:dihydroxy-acid dehydratase
VSPEAAVGGPLALVENGDEITIDVERASIELNVPADMIAARKARLGTPALKKAVGWLQIYQREVQPMSSGVVLVRDP